MDALIDPSTGDYTGQRITTLANAVYLRLMTPLGRYWALPKLGSRLHELRREKDLPRFYTLARQYAEQALAPILADGRAREITVTASGPRPGWCLLEIEVIQASGQVEQFQHFVRVS